MAGKTQKSHGADVLMGRAIISIRTSAPCNFWDFPTISRGQNCLLHYPPEACRKWSASGIREVGGALPHCFTRKALRKRDCHHTSTKF